MCRKNILLLLSLFFCWGLSAQSVTEHTTKSSMYHLAKLTRQQMEMNLSNSSMNTMIPLLGYTIILSQRELNYNTLLEEPPNSNSETSELMYMLNLQMENLLNLEIQWQAMEAHYRQLSVYNKELLNLLNESRDTITQLRKNLEAALERVQDAEEGAIALLDESAEIYQRAKNTVANITMLKSQLVKSEKSVTVGFTVAAISFGIGSPLIIEGVYAGNSTMTWAGAGTIVGTGAIWAVGHYLLNWW